MTNIYGLDWGIRNKVTVVSVGGRLILRIHELTDAEQAAYKVIKALPRGSFLAIEDLRGLYRKGGFKKGRGVYLPYGRFQSILRDLAAQAGITILVVKPCYTSSTCPRCRNISRASRSGAVFKCLRCGYVADADIVGAWNIALRAHKSLLLKGGSPPPLGGEGMQG
jgi:hypothetical protein